MKLICTRHMCSLFCTLPGAREAVIGFWCVVFMLGAMCVPIFLGCQSALGRSNSLTRFTYYVPFQIQWTCQLQPSHSYSYIGALTRISPPPSSPVWTSNERPDGRARMRVFAVFPVVALDPKNDRWWGAPGCSVLFCALFVGWETGNSLHFSR